MRLRLVSGWFDMDQVRSAAMSQDHAPISKGQRHGINPSATFGRLVLQSLRFVRLRTDAARCAGAQCVGPIEPCINHHTTENTGDSTANL